MKIGELIEGVEYIAIQGIGFKYKVKGGKLYVFDCSTDSWMVSVEKYNNVKQMRFEELEFNPKNGEKFWAVDLSMDSGAGFSYWDGDKFDMNLKRFGIYRTKEEAERRAAEVMQPIIGYYEGGDK